MFRCELCGVVAPPKTPSHRLVVQSRQRVYPPVTKPKKQEGEPRRARRKGPKADNGGVGVEIAVERLVCARCLRLHEQQASAGESAT